LAAAGFRVVAPRSARLWPDRQARADRGLQHPEPGGRYRRSLVNSVGADTASIVGHDWGAPVAWHCSLLRPDIFHAIALLSVPYLPRGATHPAQAMQAIA